MKNKTEWHDKRRAVWLPLDLHTKLRREALRLALRTGCRWSPGAVAERLLRKVMR